MDWGEWGKLLGAGAILFAALRYVIRNEFSTSVDKVTNSANHLADTLSRVDATLTRAIQSIHDHEVRIAVIETRAQERGRDR
jgi:hypothetical protein